MKCDTYWIIYHGFAQQKCFISGGWYSVDFPFLVCGWHLCLAFGRSYSNFTRRYYLFFYMDIFSPFMKKYTTYWQMMINNNWYVDLKYFPFRSTLSNLKQWQMGNIYNNHMHSKAVVTAYLNVCILCLKGNFIFSNTQPLQLLLTVLSFVFVIFTTK